MPRGYRVMTFFKSNPPKNISHRIPCFSAWTLLWEQKTVIFIDIPANRIQHKFLVYLFGRTVMKPPEFFVFLYVPKV